MLKILVFELKNRFVFHRTIDNRAFTIHDFPDSGNKVRTYVYVFLAGSNKDASSWLND